MNDLDLLNTESFILVSELGSILAFGQYYLKNERCHLSRLVVSPFERGNGIGKHLIAQLSSKGCDELGVAGCSLFVMADNKPAMNLYLSLGFEEVDCPQEIAEEMIFMVRLSGRN